MVLIFVRYIVTLQNNVFYDNRASASLYGSLYIFATNIQVMDSYFQKFNLFDSTWSSKFSQSISNK